jgi:DNA-binding beta-propeller fold protein YncE
MHMNCFRCLILPLLVAALTVLNAAAQSNVFATGLQTPIRLLFTPRGSLLVSEGGPFPATANTGRVSILDRSGNRRTLLEGLPSGPAHFTNPYGPTSMALDGRTLYLVIGEGDVMAGVPPNYGINLNGPSSPIVVSVLKIRFSAQLEQIMSGFRLTLDHHWQLFDGFELELRNQTGDRATIELLTAFRTLIRDPAGISAVTVRESNPYGVVLDTANRTLYISDASRDSVVKVDTMTGRSQLLVRFPPVQRQTPEGVTLRVDNVPNGISRCGDDLLVSFLTAGPFPPGEGTVKSVHPVTGAVANVITGLTAVSDVLCSYVGRIFTLEARQDPSVPSGRLRVYDDRTPWGRTLASDLLFPTGMAQDPMSGDIFIALYFAGQIVQVQVR